MKKLICYPLPTFAFPLSCPLLSWLGGCCPLSKLCLWCVLLRVVGSRVWPWTLHRLVLLCGESDHLTDLSENSKCCWHVSSLSALKGPHHKCCCDKSCISSARRKGWSFVHLTILTAPTVRWCCGESVLDRHKHRERGAAVRGLINIALSTVLVKSGASGSSQKLCLLSLPCLPSGIWLCPGSWS